MEGRKEKGRQGRTERGVTPINDWKEGERNDKGRKDKGKRKEGKRKEGMRKERERKERERKERERKERERKGKWSNEQAKQYKHNHARCVNWTNEIKAVSMTQHTCEVQKNPKM